MHFIFHIKLFTIMQICVCFKLFKVVASFRKSEELKEPTVVCLVVVEILQYYRLVDATLHNVIK